ncbi:MAG: OmpA family protein [Rhodobacter sp.]|nr:OmpA family protein [Rhodobacter sp.]MCA3517930.1 OmpA family protein [Rhodobacter sp.]MCA6229743.1 OmpA family protein [Phenylobacterium sp.]
MRWRLTGTIVALLTLGAIPASAAAEDVDEINAIIRSLAPITGQTEASPAPTTEGTSNLPAVEIKPVLPTAQQPTVSVRVIQVQTPQISIVIAPERSIELEVYCEKNSAQLSGSSTATLELVTKALESAELRDSRFLIAGHTDASGTADYNRTLSQRRSDAVRDHILRNFPVEPERLIAHGFGEDWLKTPETPYAAINRRVEIILIVGGS